MKAAVLYFSRSGHTKAMAQEIARGMESVGEIKAEIFDIDHIDAAFLAESKAVVFGTPTYYANTCWQVKKWFDESKKYDLSGKLGAAFATADYVQGGADCAIETVLHHLLVKGMLVYSSGGSFGQPIIHLGAVALSNELEEKKPLFFTFGERIAKKAKELFKEA